MALSVVFFFSVVWVREVTVALSVLCFFVTGTLSWSSEESALHKVNQESVNQVVLRGSRVVCHSPEPHSPPAPILRVPVVPVVPVGVGTIE